MSNKVVEKQNVGKTMLFVWNGIVLLHLFILIARYVYAIYVVDPIIISNNILYITLVAILPFGLWILSTKEDYWNFHQRKLFMMGCFVVNAVFSIFQPIYTAVWNFAVVKIFALPPTELLTKNMIINLARVAMFFITAFVCGLILFNIFGPLYSARGKEMLLGFKIAKVVDTRAYKENLYDFCVCKRLDNGKPITVSENDRFIHTLVNGVSGTGKTSTTLVVSIYNDLLKKATNREHRQKALLDMILADKAKLISLPKNKWEDPVVVPRKKYKEEFEEIFKQFPDCGMTVMAPNAGLTDDTVALCDALGVPVLRIDPMPDEVTRKPKTHLKGLNPFYIPPTIKGQDRVVMTFEKARNFADTMQQIFDASGAGDPYFAGINTAVTTNVAVACILGSEYVNHGRQTNIRDIQEWINDYSKLKTYVKSIEANILGGEIVVENISKKKENKPSSGPIGAETVSEQPMQEGRSNSNIDSERLRESPYYAAIFYIKQELLSPEVGEKMFDQARGLRNMINSFLANPRIASILTSEDTIDFDENLRSNHITVINTAIELGSSVSTAFGSLFILNMQQAVYRRRKNTRSDHFWYVDELPIYLHPVWEQMVAFFRQYRVGLIMAIQTLDQFEKTAATKYLRSVMMGCATHLVFGRLSPTDMKMYQDKSGVMEIQLSQKTTSQDASILSMDNKASVSERITPTMVNVVEGSQMSKRDFQEITIFTVKDGNVGDPVFAKTAFLDRNKFNKRTPQYIRWENLYIEDTRLESSSYKKTDALMSAPRQKVADVVINDADSVQHIVNEDNLIDDERTIGIESDFSLPIDWSEVDAPSEDVSE